MKHRKSNPFMTAIRTAVAYPLLALQLLLVLFLFELPYWVWDRFFARNRGDAFYRAQRAVARWFVRLYPFGMQHRVNVRADAFPQPCVIVCNHQSSLDFLIALLLPVNARWFVNPRTHRIPLMGELTKLARHIKVEDEPGDPERPRGFDTALDWLGRGVSVLLFPEGSRSPDGQLRRFKNGAFLLAIEAGVPIVPVVLDGTGACLRKGSLVVRHPDVVLKVLPPVSTEGLSGEADAATLKAEVQQRMAAEIDALRDSKNKPGLPFVNGWLARLAMLAVALVFGAAACLSIYVDNFCIIQPPAFDGDRSLAQVEPLRARLAERQATLLGENWRRRRDGIHEVGLHGSPWERGYANATLTGELLEAQERYMFKTAREFLPYDASFWLVKQLVAVQNRTLPAHVSSAEQQEILGLAEGSTDHFPEEGWPLFHRVVSYHAAHDISHFLIDNPLLSRRDVIGCTGFAAWGDATINGDLWVGRNFDWEAGEVFDRDKCIIYVWPNDGIPYVHVAWAGMAGAVTGMNAQGLSIHLNAARTDETRFGRVGTPVSLLVRRVLAQARNIDEAHAIIREAAVFVSDSYLVASRAEKRAVVIEKSPLHCHLREADRPGLLLQSNHFHGDAWRDDSVHRKQMETATTLYRLQRLEELTRSRHGSIDAAASLAILRDRAGRGGKNIGFGNRNAIDAGICAHSVIMNVSTGEMWVGAGPHTYGDYVYVPVAAMLEAGPAGAVRMRIDGARNLPGETKAAASNLAEFRRVLKLARVSVDAGNIRELEAHVQSLRNLNPHSFETAYMGGRLAWLNGEHEEAARHFSAALERDPHYEATREDIRVWISRASRRAGK